MIKFKIVNASANKAERIFVDGQKDEMWQVSIRADIMNPENIKSTKHNKVMPIASKFFKKIREDIGVKTEQLKVGPHVFSKNSWTCTFNVICRDNEEETLHYMVWYISSCKTREYEI
jgi:hypothetical protein